jgi:hypothetical protein
MRVPRLQEQRTKINEADLAVAGLKPVGTLVAGGRLVPYEEKSG